MNVALRVYEQLTDAGEDKVRARAIADGFEQMEERYAPLRDTATQGHLRETELRLQKEIREVELKLGNEIREVELKLTKEIETVRLELTKEIETVRLELTKEIESVRLEVAEVRREVKEVELKLTKEIETVRRDIKQLDVKIADSKAELVRWVVAVGVLQFALISGLLLKLTHAL